MSDTPTTNTVAKAIGRLAAEYRGGDRDALSFANAADAAMDPLRQLERENAKLREELVKLERLLFGADAERLRTNRPSRNCVSHSQDRLKFAADAARVRRLSGR